MKDYFKEFFSNYFQLLWLDLTGKNPQKILSEPWHAMTSLLHFITGSTVMLLGIILGIIGLSQAFRYILHWLIYSVCPFMNAWCNIWDRGFIRLKVSSFHLITTVCGLMEPQLDLQLGVTSVWPQTCDGTLKVQLKYLASISMDGKLMSWCSAYAAVHVSRIWLPCVPRSSSFSGYAEKLCHHKSGIPLILFIRLQRKLTLVLPGYSFYMLKTPPPAVSYGKQKLIRTQTGNIIHMQLIIQVQVWCSASDRMIGEARVVSLLKTFCVSGRNESNTKMCSLIVTEGEL